MVHFFLILTTLGWLCSWGGMKNAEYQAEKQDKDTSRSNFGFRDYSLHTRTFWNIHNNYYIIYQKLYLTL